VTVNLLGHPATVLELQVRNGELKGRVSGQPNFLLKGTPEAGTYESAFSKGTIQCNSETIVDVGYLFRPWNAIFLPLDSSTIQNFHSPSVLTNSCYFGDRNLALEEVIASINPLSSRVNSENDSIEITVLEKECLEPYGNHPDDYGCRRWSQPKPKVYVMDFCDYSPSR
jgi:hypothetical protein